MTTETLKVDEERAKFEKHLRDEMLFSDEELEWQPERNCYAIYGVHLAYQCWLARALLETSS